MRLLITDGGGENLHRRQFFLHVWGKCGENWQMKNR